MLRATSSAIRGDKLCGTTLCVITRTEQGATDESDVAPRVEKFCGEGWIPSSASCDFVEQIWWVERIVSGTQEEGRNPNSSQNMNRAALFVIVRRIAVSVYNGCERIVELP